LHLVMSRRDPPSRLAGFRSSSQILVLKQVKVHSRLPVKLAKTVGHSSTTSHGKHKVSSVPKLRLSALRLLSMGGVWVLSV